VFPASGGEKVALRLCLLKRQGRLVPACRLRRGLAAGLESKGSDSPSASPRRRLRCAAEERNRFE
jgi:hypothetical protein